MKKLINLGKSLDRNEQRSISGGYGCLAIAIMCDLSCSCSADGSACSSGYYFANCYCAGGVDISLRC